MSSRPLIITVIATAVVIALWDFIAAEWHSRDAEREVISLANSIPLGATREAVADQFSRGGFHYLTRVGNPADGEWVFQTPLRMGARNWIVTVGFERDRVGAVRVGTSDAPQRTPEGAPADRIEVGPRSIETALRTIAGSSSNEVQPSRGVSAPSTPGVCLREGAKLVGSQPVQVAKKLRAPKKTRHVYPEFPELPPGTSVGGVWVGEGLIDQHGKIAQVWTVRPLLVEPAFPPLNEAIVAAIRQWEFEPTVVEKVAVPVCMTVTLNINLQ